MISIRRDRGDVYKRQQILRSIMQNDAENGLTLYGKTGTGPDGEGWFVGFVQNRCV